MPNANHLLFAAQWLQSIMLGTVATTIAIIAVAIVGVRLFDGHVEVRRGAAVVLGCFILFGAPFIATGLLTLTDREPRVAAPAPPPPVALATPAPRPTAYDPYAGATLPQGRYPNFGPAAAQSR